MCIKCHLEMNIDNILHELNNININDFSKVTSENIDNLFISASGYNGNNIRKISLKLLDEYLIWTEKNKDKVSIKLTNLKMKIKYVNKNKINNKSKCDIVTNLITYLHDMNELT